MCWPLFTSPTHVQTHKQMCLQVLYRKTIYMYTQTCPLRLHGPLCSLHSHPRVPVSALVSLTSLAEPLSQLVITTLPPHSPLALSCCDLTICGNWLGPKHHVTHTTGDPKSWGHISSAKILRMHKHTCTHTHTHTHTHTCDGYSCGRHELVVKRAERLFIVHLDKQTMLEKKHRCERIKNKNREYLVR